MNPPFAVAWLLFASTLWLWIILLYWSHHRMLRLQSLATFGFSASAALWSAGYALEIVAQRPEIKIAAHHLKYIGMIGFAPSVLVFSICQAGYAHMLTRRWRAVLVIMPVLTAAVIASNSLHGLMWTHIGIHEQLGLRVVDEVKGVWGWANLLYVYAECMLAVVIFIRYFSRQGGLYRQQFAALGMAVAAPLLFSLPSTLGLVELNLTPFAFPITTAAVIWGLVRHRMFNVVPVSADVVAAHSPDALFVIDVQGRIVYANPAAERFADKPLRSMIGSTPEAVFSRLDVLSALDRLPDEDVTLSGQYRRQREDQLQYLEVRRVVMHGRRHERTGSLLIIHDITTQKLAETALQKALDQQRELADMQSRIVSIVSHEFRTPLTVIKTSAQMIGRYREQMKPEALAQRLEVIDQQTVVIDDLIDDVVSLSRLQAHGPQVHLEPHNLSAFCAGALKGYTCDDSSRRVSIAASAAQWVAIDPKLMRLVVVNLVNNALKYSPKDAPVEVEICEHGRETVLTVSDRGIGIPESDRAHIMQPFYRATNVGQVTGSGLGLAIVRHAVELQGGSITFISTPGVGTSFMVAFPTLVVEEAAAAG